MPPGEDDLNRAVAAYWGAKQMQGDTARATGSTAEGKAKGVRGGRHFAPIVELVARFFTDAGYSPGCIGTSGNKTIIPGYFRPGKAWDLVVVNGGVLVAAIEMKALGGPSFGNNFNNRVEEALGNALDLAHASRESLCGPEPPWLGYFLIMDDAPESRRPVRERTATFPLDEVWQGHSYQQRFGLAGERLLDGKHYDALCYVISSPEDPEVAMPAAALNWAHFSASIQARLTYLAELGYPRPEGQLSLENPG